MNSQVNFKNTSAISGKSKILSVGTFLPKQIVKSDDLFEEIGSEKQYGIPTNWMSRFMGIVERRMSDADAKPSDLAIPAARKAIENFQGNIDEIDVVIFCGIERDQPEPATAHVIQNALGINASYVFDIGNACIGFVDGIQVASNFITANMARYAMVVTGEISTHVTRATMESLKSGLTRDKAKDLIGSLSVGDAGGCVILGAADPLCNEGFEGFNNRVDSSHIDKCIYSHTKNGIVGQMKLSEILNEFILMHQMSIKETFEKLGWDKFDWVISHQTGTRNFNAFAGLDGVNSKTMIKTYTNLGNLTTATLPMSWEKLLLNGKVKKGDRVGGLFTGSGLTTCQFGIYF